MLQHGLDRAQPRDLRRLQQHARHAVEAVERVHDHRDDAEHEADQDLRGVAEPEQDDQQRIEGEDRDRVIGGEQRIERLAHSLAADAARRRSRRRRRWPGRKRVAALANVLSDCGVELAGQRGCAQRSMTIRCGGCMVSLSMTPVRHSTSSSATSSDRTSAVRIQRGAGHRPSPGLPMAFMRLLAQRAPQPRRDRAELGRSHDAAVALARPVGLDDVDHAAGPRRHHADAVGQHRRLVERVRDQEDGRAVSRHSRSTSSPISRRVCWSSAPNGSSSRISRGCSDQRAGDADALAHAAGKLRRIAVGEVGEPHHRERILDRGACARPRRDAMRASPKAMLSCTVSQGKQASSWNTTPMPSGISPRDRPALERTLAARRLAPDRRSVPAGSTCRSRTGRRRRRIRPCAIRDRSARRACTASPGRAGRSKTLSTPAKGDAEHRPRRSLQRILHRRRQELGIDDLLDSRSRR